jgi:hypothetical protein
MYGIYEVVSTGPDFSANVERKLRAEYGMFTTEDQARKFAEALGERYSVDQVTTG